ncbi:hypothetical protein QAD02_012516 [Eretmocerus hayati]|uniref:Uncharacterized protein n=1 Tax=Eretmocerus hayati TaxID=131215 RepID=A0ACC2P2H9_9HYME|nr:hypothetical protein QAD02_012516 [Eretmocerus hayati]
MGVYATGREAAHKLGSTSSPAHRRRRSGDEGSAAVDEQQHQQQQSIPPNGYAAMLIKSPPPAPAALLRRIGVKERSGVGKIKNVVWLEKLAGPECEDGVGGRSKRVAPHTPRSGRERRGA